VNTLFCRSLLCLISRPVESLMSDVHELCTSHNQAGLVFEHEAQTR
jgi:hypothetical protein